MFAKLWKDEAGFVTLEYLIGATILVLGMIVGLSALRKVITSELAELASAIGTLSQNYSYQGLSACGSTVDGANANGDVPQGISVFTVAPTTSVLGINSAICP